MRHTGTQNDRNQTDRKAHEIHKLWMIFIEWIRFRVVNTSDIERFSPSDTENTQFCQLEMIKMPFCIFWIESKHEIDISLKWSLVAPSINSFPFQKHAFQLHSLFTLLKLCRSFHIFEEKAHYIWFDDFEWFTSKNRIKIGNHKMCEFFFLGF